jgi:hypothetical protein
VKIPPRSAQANAFAERGATQLTLTKTSSKQMQYRPGLLDATGRDLTPICNPTSKDL